MQYPDNSTYITYMSYPDKSICSISTTPYKCTYPTLLIIHATCSTYPIKPTPV